MRATTPGVVDNPRVQTELHRLTSLKLPSSCSVRESSRLIGEFEPSDSTVDYKPLLRKKKAFRLATEGFQSSQVGATGTRLNAKQYKPG
jgi:uncharacterized ParB-like nuclease family protein